MYATCAYMQRNSREGGSVPIQPMYATCALMQSALGQCPSCQVHSKGA